MATLDAALACTILAACGSTSAPPPVAPDPRPAPSPRVDEHARREEIVAAHRVLEEEQQDAFAASCADPVGAHARCVPSCYAKAPPDPRAGKRLGGTVEITHVACGAAGAYAIVDDADRAALALRRASRIPPAHKQGSWQADVEAALVLPGLPRGDALRVTGTWRDIVEPTTKEHLHCVTVSHFARSLRRKLDDCGGDGTIACEAGGNAAAHGLDVVHYRLAEARALQAAGNATACQQAALEAIAVAHGLPRWRQYVTLNVGAWVPHAGYRTRFDGILDEDALFARAASLGGEAEVVHAACGGASPPATTPAQEQSFHTCW